MTTAIPTFGASEEAIARAEADAEARDINRLAGRDPHECVRCRKVDCVCERCPRCGSRDAAAGVCADCDHDFTMSPISRADSPTVIVSRAEIDAARREAM